MKIISNIFWKMRVLAFYLFIVLISVTVLPAISFTKYLRLSYDSQYKLAKLYSSLFLFGLKLFCGISLEVFGMEKIPNSPFVILPNHQSFADNFIMPVIFPIKQSWIMKKELLSYPLLGPGLKVLKPIAIDRTQSFSVRQIITQGSEKINQGLSVVIYPEGTRVNPDKNVKFKPSGVKLAQEAKVPIVMVAHNAGIYWPKGFWVRQPGKIKIVISEPISIEECINTPVRELNDKIEKWITEKKQELIENLIDY
jgi:1-acyl-sn-glycerol-3-phosphate acyltransferase